MVEIAARGFAQSLRLAPSARAIVLVGFLVTVGTGAGLFLARGARGTFAWTIRAPLTAAFIGAGYLAGAALSLALALRDGRWERIRIVLVTALALTTTNLVATLRFSAEFALDSTGLQRLVAWAWLVIYLTFPPLLLLVIVRHERRSSRRPSTVGAGLAALTRGIFGSLGAAVGGLGLWLSIDPDGRLAASWPWKLPPGAIVGTWLLMLAAMFAWALFEDEWTRVRIALAPLAAALALHLLAAARLSDTFTGSDRAVGVYVGGLVLLALATAAAWLTERSRSSQRLETQRRGV